MLDTGFEGNEDAGVNGTERRAPAKDKSNPLTEACPDLPRNASEDAFMDTFPLGSEASPFPSAEKDKSRLLTVVCIPLVMSAKVNSGDETVPLIFSFFKLTGEEVREERRHTASEEMSVFPVALMPDRGMKRALTSAISASAFMWAVTIGSSDRRSATFAVISTFKAFATEKFSFSTLSIFDAESAGLRER